MKLAVLVSIAAVLGACKSRRGSEVEPAPPPPLVLGHGVVASEVSTDGVTIWSRASAAATISAEVHPIEATAGRLEGPWLTAEVDAATDLAAALRFGGLAPATRYGYTVFAQRAGTESPRLTGSFTTPARGGDERPVQFAWSGDLSGQNVCRDASRGFPIATPIIATQPDFFVALGDMVYADGVCEAIGAFGNAQVVGDFGPAATIESFWAHWRYNRADPGMQALFAKTPSYAVWDDHEVVNDFGPSDDTRSELPYRAGVKLSPLGLRAFRDYNPIAKAGAPLYRSARWGKHLELLLLDNRSHRDANRRLDDSAEAKTMLGKAQLAWLVGRLRESDATWKIIVSSVPIAIPTGSDPPEVSRDGWADFGSGQGFERELRQILEAGAAARANILWITTDVHFATVLRFNAPLSSGPYTFHEAVVGPMSAGLFPSTDLDDTFAPERLFFHGPEANAVLTYDQALTYMTFGTAAINAHGSLALRVIDGNGKTLDERRLEPR